MSAQVSDVMKVDNLLGEPMDEEDEKKMLTFFNAPSKTKLAGSPDGSLRPRFLSLLSLLSLPSSGERASVSTPSWAGGMSCTMWVQIPTSIKATSR